jgi:hemerythrin-like domain-containing protein
VSRAPQLLDDDGRVSGATYLMMSHLGLRRDLARFALALERVAAGDTSRIEALREEWGRYHEALHGHHHAEDTGVFPELARQHPELAELIDGLKADHQRIDPLLDRGDRAFAALPDLTEAAGVVSALTELLSPHLAREEAELVPHLRGQHGFPEPEDEATVQTYVDGFAWVSQGVAEDILAKVDATLPESITSRLPAARQAFAARCERVWGTSRAGAARTPIPDRESL